MRAAWLALFVLVLPASVAADDLADFERARRAYAEQRYDEAVRQLEGLVGGPVPRIQNRALVLESRKYLAASLLFSNRRADAESQLEQLLQAEPSYALDPLEFPADVTDLFGAVRDRVQREAAEREEAARRALEEARARDAAELLAYEAWVSSLRELASAEVEVEERSRWVASLPFGVGQFQRGDAALGWVFAISEGALAVGSIVTFLAHDSLRDDLARNLSADERAAGVALEEGLRIGNWVTTGLLIVTAIVGIVDAHASFEGTVRRTRAREVPPDPRAARAQPRE